MKICAFIPARYAATRFPGKLMKMLGDKPVIRHVYDAVIKTGLFHDVIVVTDSDIIYSEITNHGGRAVMSIKEHASGSDRIAEAAANMDVDVIINVQGDEPFIQKEPLEKLVRLFKDEEVKVASLMRAISPEELNNPNSVKVHIDKDHYADFFGRTAKSGVNYYLHIGVYAYRKKVLLDFTGWPPAPLELSEKLEQLRYLAHGIKIKMAETDYMNIAIDTPEDLVKAEALLNTKH